jgi:putative ABC transport system permease protein
MTTELRDGRMMLAESLRQDVQYAIRRLFAHPAFTLIPVLTLALGIGATTAIFSVVKTVLLEPLPYPDADRLVRVIEQGRPGAPSGPSVEKATMSEAAYLEWRPRTRTLADIGLYNIAPASTLATPQQNVRLAGARITPSILSMLGVQPALGRLFTPDDEHDHVLILSSAAWQQIFASDPQVVGRSVLLDGNSYTVIGVLPAAFGFPIPQTGFWRPYTFRDLANRRTTYSAMLAKLAPGVSVETATTEANVLGREIRGSIGAPGAEGRASTFEVVTMKDDLVAPGVASLRVLMVSAGVVLLIACANVANLLLARGSARQREMAVRLALGASRARVVRQLLIESLVLALAGGIGGIVLAMAGVRLVRELTAVDTPAFFQFAERVTHGGSTIMPRLDELGIDLTVMVFALGSSILTGVIFGIMPALQLSRGDGRHGGSVGPAPAAASTRVVDAGSRISDVLVIAQLALATMLLVSAGLLMHSFLKLSSLETGYNPSNVLIFQLVIDKTLKGPQKLALADELVTRLRSRPQVQAAGFINAPPLVPLRLGFGTFVPPGRTLEEMKQEPVKPQGRSASRDYLRAMGVRLIDGRFFDDRDTAGSGRVLLVNRALAQRYFGRTSPVGASVRLMGEMPWQIVGVVDDMRQGLLTQEPVPMLFVDPRQVIEEGEGLALGFLCFAVRTTGDPTVVVSDLRTLTRELGPAVTLDSLSTMDQLMTGAVRRPRFYAVLLGIFAGIAAVLAAVGIYGVLAFSVARRTREIGVRIALGAQPAEVVRLVMRHGVLLTVIGIAGGVAGAVALSRLLSSLLFGLTPVDTSTYVIVAVGFTIVALTAAYVPARRAANVDPVIALRYE